MDQFTAAQKLGRLKMIDETLRHFREDYKEGALLEQAGKLAAERRAILASVGAPPLELIGNPWGEAWSTAFAEQFPGFDKGTLDLWFMNACSAGAQQGMRDAEGLKRDESPAYQALTAILRGVRAKRIRCLDLLIVEDGAPPITLQQLIEHTLGAEVAS